MKIIISDIPGDFPPEYSEQIYLDTRSVRVGRDNVIIETAKSHKALNDQKFRKRKIQSLSYSKYTVELITTESVDIDRINMAKTVSIVQDSAEIHSAEIIDFQEATKLQGSEFRLYNLIYRNLLTKQTVDYLSSETAEASNRAYFEYINYDTQETVRINTLLNVNYSFTPYEFSENNDNGLSIRSREQGFSVAELTAYVSESEKADLLKYVNYYNISTLKICENQDTLVSYEAIEVPEIITDETELEGLYPIIIKLRYAQELKYPFSREVTLVASPNNINDNGLGGTYNSTITYAGVGDWYVDYTPTFVTTVKSQGNLQITFLLPSLGKSDFIVLRSTYDANISATIIVNQGII
jgi:hypothetical protein